jgi:prolipoprotein diacylglyceryltransferase
MVAFFGLFAWLWQMESKYRTLGWYKGQKSQASSGFVASMYLIAYGFIGFAGSNFRPQNLYFLSIPVVPLAYLGILGLGMVVLFFRAGMNLRKMAKDWFGMTPLIPKN